MVSKVGQEAGLLEICNNHHKEAFEGKALLYSNQKSLKRRNELLLQKSPHYIKSHMNREITKTNKKNNNSGKIKQTTKIQQKTTKKKKGKVALAEYLMLGERQKKKKT